MVIQDSFVNVNIYSVQVVVLRLLTDVVSLGYSRRLTNLLW